MNKYNSIKKILIFQNYLFAIINSDFIFPSEINISNPIIYIKFEKLQYIKYYKMLNNYDIENRKSISNIAEIAIKDILLKNRNIIKYGKKALLEFENNIKNYNKNKYLSYFISSKITSNGLYMLINYKEKIVSKSVYTKILEIKKSYHQKDIQKEKIVEYFGIHKSVIPIYGTRKVYTISKINFDKSPSNTIIKYKNKDNNLIITINLLDYYNKIYKLKIKDENQYLIEAQSSKKNKNIEPIYLIPELVNIIGLDNTDNNNNKKNGIIINPDKRMEKINNIYNLFNSDNIKIPQGNYKYKLKTPKEVNEEWGINLGNFFEFKAKIIPQPKISFSNINIDANQGKFRLHNPLFKKEIKNSNSFYLFFENDKNYFINPKNIILNNINDKIILKNNTNWEDIEKELLNKDILNKKEKTAGIIFLSKNNQDKYNQLKKFFINNYPNLITQFIKIETFNNKLQNR